MRSAVLPLLGLAAAFAGCRSTPSGGREADRQAILEVLEDQVRSWNRGDLEGFMRGYLDSAGITFFSGRSALRGHATLLERYRKNYASEGKEMGLLAFEDLDVEVLAPDAALVRGRWRVRTSKEELGGLFTLLFRRFGSGWRVVHDHTSS